MRQADACAHDGNGMAGECSTAAAASCAAHAVRLTQDRIRALEALVQCNKHGATHLKFWTALLMLISAAIAAGNCATTRSREEVHLHQLTCMPDCEELFATVAALTPARCSRFCSMSETPSVVCGPRTDVRPVRGIAASCIRSLGMKQCCRCSCHDRCCHAQAAPWLCIIFNGWARVVRKDFLKCSNRFTLLDTSESDRLTVTV
jgi:hypothetical protein